MMQLHFLTVATSSLPPGNDWLAPQEQETLATLRLPKRRADWRLGRYAAKLAVCSLARSGLSLAEARVQAAPDGAPELFFPDGAAPFGLSLSHAGGRALAVVGARGAMFGADIESVEPRSPAFVADFFTTAEQASVQALPPSERDRAATLVWSAKEAVLKALRTGLREDTRSVEIGPLPQQLLRHPLEYDRAGGCPLSAVVPARELFFCGRACESAGQIITVMAAEPFSLRSIHPERLLGQAHAGDHGDLSAWADNGD